MERPARASMGRRGWTWVLFCALSFLLAAPRWSAASVPVIYGTDLFHPHDDPDDHFDLATLLALPELDVKAILLDQGERQSQRPGAIPLRQVMELTHRQVPFAIGLGHKLESPTDDGRRQPAEFQAAVDLLLKTLRESPGPVTILTAGSVRDVCAGWNREPALFKEKVGRLYLNIGNAAPGGSEYNVDLDSQAYVGLLRSGLPLYLCFCLPMQPGDTNGQFSTWWRFRQADVLPAAPPAWQNFFIYALQECAPEELDPMQSLSADLRPWHHLVWAMDRNMWCTASLLHAAGRTVRKTEVGWTSLRPAAAGGADPAPFTFLPVRIEVDASGKTAWTTNADRPNAHLFQVVSADYGPAMRDCLRELLAALPGSGSGKGSH